MAELTNTGIDFTDVNGNVTTSLNSKNDIIPISSANGGMFFFESSAPPGWTKQTSHNNKALRVVNGTGGGTGGSTVFTTVFGSGTHLETPYSTPGSSSTGGHTLSSSQIPSHSHANGNEVGLDSNPQNPDGSYTGGDVARRSNSPDWTRTSPATGDVSGGSGQSHDHPFSASGTVPNSFSLDVAVQYVDLILCKRVS
tara:strand:- start:4726 stop:5316 length:591 start_codon:yes stop_codon:yes gene_type:complete